MNTKLVLSWKEIEFYIDKLVTQIQKSNLEFKYITGIPRGGLIPAVLLSHKLNIPYLPFESVSGLFLFNQKDVLIVDDISDTGNTLFDIADLKLATLLVRHTSKLFPDFYAEEIKDDSWIVFPWEQVSAPAIQDYLVQ